MAIRNDSDQLLEDLRNAIDNLKIDITNSVGDVTVNTGQLEALLGDSGSKSISSGLYPVGRAVGGTDAEDAALTANPVLTGGRYDASARSITSGNAAAIALDARGHVLTQSTITGTVTATLSAADNAVLDTIDAVLDTIKVDTEAIETASEAILAKNTEIEASANALIAANHTDLLAVEASADALIAANHTDLVAIDTVLDDIKVDTEAIETAVEAIQADAAAIEVLLTSANVDHAANEALLTTIDADTSSIKTDTNASKILLGALETLSTAANVDLAAIEALSTAANVDLAAIEALNITNNIFASDVKDAVENSETHLYNLQVLSTAANVDLAAIEVLITAGNVDLAALEVLITSIKTAVEIIDNAINGNEMQVDIVAPLPAGSNTIGNVAITSIAAGSNTIGTVNLGATDNAVLDAIEVTQNKLVAPTSTVYLTGTKAFTGPFYAITALTETVIDVSEGDTNIVESNDSGAMQDVAANITLPAGMTLHGNFAVIELDSGTAIGYAGAGITVAVASS